MKIGLILALALTLTLALVALSSARMMVPKQSWCRPRMAISDAELPSIVSFDIEPKVVNLSQSNQTIKFTVQLKSFYAIRSGDMELQSPSKKYLGVNFSDDNRVSGDSWNGIYVIIRFLMRAVNSILEMSNYTIKLPMPNI
ncbi:MAG: hypothetical protein LUQ38_06835 [Methanotrichaceae archaeon]|nr:hypothetical protein [Methanotrichaceae archaeon]